MGYPLPLQVTVIWHPESDKTCRPHAEKIYTALNRDPYQPLVPGIGIPVFFRCAGADPRRPLEPPAPVQAPAGTHDLRVILLTAEYVLDDKWEAYRASSLQEIAGRHDQAALVILALGDGIASGEEKVVAISLRDARAGEMVLQNVLLQASRLLAHRPRNGGASERGAAPLRLFLSHTKRDKVGLKVARDLKGYLDDTAVDRFFDEVSIQPGDKISTELEEGIADSALVAIRTDGYVASPWCLMELALAKKHQRPMVVVDALSGTEPRSSSLLSNLPGIRLDPASSDDARLERVGNFIGLEVLRFLYGKAQLDALKQQSLVPPDAVLLPRPPEPRDFSARPAGAQPGKAQVFVYPDPVLNQEEAAEYASYGASLATPISLHAKRLAGLRLGISVAAGNKPEEAALGISSLHVEDATRVVARQALAAGATLVYGGALNANTLDARNLTESLFDMIGAYNKTGLDQLPPLLNYTPWPWWQEAETPWLAEKRQVLKVIKCVPPAEAPARGAGDGPGHVGRLAATPQGRVALARSLSAMRQQVIAETGARVVLGGKPDNFMGAMPGIVEEALLAIRARQPLFILGAFGGAARLVADAIRGRKPEGLTLAYQTRSSPPYAAMLEEYEREAAAAGGPKPVDYAAITKQLEDYGLAGLSANGLTQDENLELLDTIIVDHALYLIMKGLAAVHRSA